MNAKPSFGLAPYHAPTEALADAPSPSGQLPHASPSVRKFARELGVDLQRVTGSGEHQRITHDDLTQWFDAAATPQGFARVGLAHGSVQGVLAPGIDSSNPIAPERAARARLDYLALGDWHGTRQIDAHTWYSGTPETDRFRANASGQALLVTLNGAGQAPAVQTLATGRYHWQTLDWDVHGDAAVDAAIDELASLGADAVVQVRVQGQLNLAAQARLQAALARAQAQVRSLEVDTSDLRLEPDEDDVRRLAAHGYVGEVIATLRTEQQDPEKANVARDALVLLAGMLERGEASSCS